MKEKQGVCAILYAVTAVLATFFSAWVCQPMYSSDDLVTAYLRSLVLLFVTACFVLGVGVYSLVAYGRRNRDWRRESIFWLAFGGVLLVAAVCVIARFGGMTSDNFSDASYPALNLNLILFGVLPLPFLIRAAVAALSAKTRTHRVMGWIAVGVALGVFVAVVAGGRLLRTVKAAESTAGMDYSLSTEDDIWGEETE